MSDHPRDGPAALHTRTSMFAELRETDHARREAAWQRFRNDYGPVIAGFARKLGARPSDLDDIMQEVIIAMISASPNFRYDRSKGRFRGYLKVVTLRIVRAVAGKRARLRCVPLETVADDAAELDEAWDAEWQRHTLTRALEEARSEYAGGPTFRAYELYALLGVPAQDVAGQLGISVDSVYQAKTRVTEALRKKVRRWELDEEQSREGDQARHA
jgi:RNA polymerase sigma-70 factor (ECF subfamily)